ncbi:hypothetical protein A6P39_028755 [Streptomyces sp. FXJ1.172]|uniref:hypothetical protein n=1 Tax=Streptomyces sp. FXJ1.172 TaxID=710705 RepID=UPI000A982017|nr:hypothetical protein [Streptomyces sp. FXJ1.172]WEO97683.1 hypothetical protein A6P39_028755 [Streptomyces sp. FXJ1.172]
MTDTTSGSGGERPGGRVPPPDEDWTPADAPARRRAPGHHTPGDPLPGERLPGEPPPSPTGPARLPGSTGPGREGLTADDRVPEDLRHPPGPAGTGPPRGGPATEGPHRTEGPRPAAENLAYARGGHPVPGGRGTPYESPMPDDGLGTPSPGEETTREAHGSDSPGPDAWPAAPGRATPSPGDTAPAPSGAGAPLLPHEDTDRWERRMRELAAGFAAEPRRVVEEADHLVEEIAGRFDAALQRRRRTLRRSWEASEDRGPGSDADTEQLRLVLRDYQELAGRLLHL